MSKSEYAYINYIIIILPYNKLGLAPNMARFARKLRASAFGG